MQIVLFYITHPNEESASSLGNLALQKKLVACANIFSINSIFPWENGIQHSEEFVLILKTISAKREEVISFIEKNHPYEVPCIISWNVEVNEAYGNWMEKNLL